ncbi:MAG TPA: hypothetical protein PK159_02200 [Steroidobacteraceae bacterium]|nr:hypothetical protein [Steroidobacteraceae bacterium]
MHAAISDMNDVLGGSAGNALELRGVLGLLTGRGGCPRLRELSIELSAELLQMGGLAHNPLQARETLVRVLDSGAAAECFQRMTNGLGATIDVLGDLDGWLPRAPVQRAVLTPHEGHVGQIDVRALGQTVVELGGGRRQAGQAIDHAVGLSDVTARGAVVSAGQPLAIVHARTEADAQSAVVRVLRAFAISDRPPDDTQLLRWCSPRPYA